MSEISKDNPDKSTGSWCGFCGRAMRHNVPRLGPAGGWVHRDTGSLLCEPLGPEEAARLVRSQPVEE